MARLAGDHPPAHRQPQGRHRTTFRRQADRLIPYEHDLAVSIRRTAFYLAVMLSAHVGAMVVFEEMPPFAAFWYTMTVVTTVGLGDLAPVTTAGRLATIALLYIGGIFALARVAGDYFEHRVSVLTRKLQGQWRWNMSGHILILNSPYRHGEQYLVRLIEQLRHSDLFSGHSVLILTDEFESGLPHGLRKLEGVAHYQGRADEPENLEAVNAAHAEVVLILAKDERDRYSDGHTFDILHQLADIGVSGAVLAEAVDDRNRNRLKRAGADIVIRPMRSYPGMTVRALVAPGSEQVIENLFNAVHDELMRYDIEIKERPWRQVANALITADLGTPVGYVDREDGKLHCNPHGSQIINATALMVIVRANAIPPFMAVDAALDNT
jgi:voltage-gated potassium channel